MKRLDDSPGHRALRVGRRSLPQQVCLLTLVTHQRMRHFGHFCVAHAVARELGDPHLWRSHTLHAWVLLPDHAHLLCGLSGEEDKAHLIARVKAVTARLGNSVLGQKDAFWARGYHDHALRTRDDLHKAVRHLVNNPIRAGLVNSPWEWPFWNSRWIGSIDEIPTLGE